MIFHAEEHKIRDYLLREPGKAKFFTGFGYSDAQWEVLRSDLVRLGESAGLKLRKVSVFGNHYETVGRLQAPDGRWIELIVAWTEKADAPGVCVLTTAYPA